jgi:hypothetical protein
MQYNAAKGTKMGDNNSADNDLAATLGKVIDDIAEAIEQRLGVIPTLQHQGGPYESSLIITYRKKLQEAATAALATVVNHPLLRPGQ